MLNKSLLLTCSAFIFLLLLFFLLFLSKTPSVVLLSFDVEPVDGKSSVIAILDVLDRTSTPATFFILGSYAEMYPDVVMQIFEGGHEVACHGYSHRKFTGLTLSEKKTELAVCKELLFNITGELPLGFRAPYNKIDGETYSVLKDEFVYDASQLSGLGVFYPASSLPEVPVSSFFFIPAEDVLWLYYLHVPSSLYFPLLRHGCCSASYLFHPHHVASPARLEGLEELIMHLKGKNTTFIRHIDFVLLYNDNN